MIRGLYTAATGMRAQELNIDVIANNLSNVNTVGYKKSRADFEDLIYQHLLEPGAPTSESTTSPSGISVGLGVRPSSVSRMFTQGDLTATGNQFDIAIEGEGFFQVTMPGEVTAYSRAGNLQVDSNGRLVTPDGYPLSPEITIPANAISVNIGKDGSVSILTPGDEAPQPGTAIQAARFANPAGLKAIGQNLYTQTTSSGAAETGTFGEQGFGRINQGFLESSNVSIVSEVVNMITGQRAYEASSKGVQTADEMLNQAINLKR